jgi:S1-C subfamily serine protease
MKLNHLNRFWFALVILTLAALACRGGQAPVEPVATSPSQNSNSANNTGNDDPTNLSQNERTHLISATVQISALFKQNGELVPFWTGSGTILTKSGLILTNAHVAAPTAQGESQAPDALAVALTQSEDKPPVLSYLAEVKAADGYLDLAVLQIVSTMDGSQIDPNNLNLPYVELGEPSNVHVGDGLFVFGFPGIGGETITFTQGIVSGFASDEQVGDRAWMKTDATIAGGNSGGLAADGSGRIIGIPTSLGAVGSGMDCRPHQDTNGDGKLDNNDICVPVANFIADVRPINFAQPLLQAAQNGKQYASPYHVPGLVSEPGTGSEKWSNFSWLDTSSADKNGCNNTGSTVNAYAAGALCVWSYFDYAGMTKGEQVRELWFHNGKNVGDFKYSWEENESGSIGTYLGNGGNPLPEGTYYVEFYAGDDLHKIGTTSEVVVGSAASSSGGQAPAPSGDTFTLYGMIYDMSTQKPISGAYVAVLKADITYEEWQKANFTEDYLAAAVQTGSDGKYKITDIPRGVSITYVFAAEGYSDYWENNVIADNKTPDLTEANIGLSK